METIEIVGYAIFGGVGLIAVSAFIAGTVMEVKEGRDRKMTPILNRQYGPQLKENAGLLEAAVEAKDRGLASKLVEERKGLLQEMSRIRPRYASLVSTEVKAYLAQGAWLEERAGKL